MTDFINLQNEVQNLSKKLKVYKSLSAITKKATEKEINEISKSILNPINKSAVHLLKQRKIELIQLLKKLEEFE